MTVRHGLAEADLQRRVVDLACLRGWRVAGCACGCGEPVKPGRRFRAGHNTRLPNRRGTLADRLNRRIEVAPSGCWLWTGATSNGYGRIRVDTDARQVHRVVYELLVGPIPPDLHLDHLCRNTLCCNPEHLEPVTPTENKLRGEAPTIKLHRRGVCQRGHSLAEHACRRKSTGRVVYCRACRRERRAAA